MWPPPQPPPPCPPPPPPPRAWAPVAPSPSAARPEASTAFVVFMVSLLRLVPSRIPLLNLRSWTYRANARAVLGVDTWPQLSLHPAHAARCRGRKRLASRPPPSRGASSRRPPCR